MPKTKNMKTQNESTHVTIRLSDQDRNRLAALTEAAGMTMSQYAGSAIFNAKIVTI